MEHEVLAVRYGTLTTTTSEVYAGFDTLGELARPAHRVLVAGHDAAVGHRFPGRAEGTGIDELVVRIERPPIT